MVSGMSRTDVIEKEGYIYAPYIPVTDGVYINGVQVWETWIKYYHYYDKDGSVIEIPCTSDWKSMERIFEKYD